MVRRHIHFCLLGALLLAACSRKAELPGGSSFIVIRAPSSLNHSYLSVPVGKKACYAVNVTGGKISSPTDQCGMSSGRVAGFVGAGQELTIADLEQGQNVNIQLLMQLVESSATCGAYTIPMTVAQVNSTYVVASQSAVPLNQESVVVTLTPAYTDGTTPNIGTALSLAAACRTPASTPIPTAHQVISAGAAIAATPAPSPAPHYVMHARAGTVVARKAPQELPNVAAPVATGGGYKLIGR